MKYYIALGSNLGDRPANLYSALQSLRELGPVGSISSVYESRAQGVKDQADFLNQICILNTPLRPFRLLRKLKTIEVALQRSFGRRWGPREIDLDIVDWEGQTIHSDILQIPHIQMLKRAFVLRPLQDVAPSFIARDGRLIRDLLINIEDKLSIKPFIQE